ncbi:hypothetical protein BGO17_03155 [Candidatus Saccharibacteria bacterium 49-20]|nr:MAG: hypothetical protein BGO17_03155 [Candidatus Saccharibacteria bacterium 49-20]
MGELARQYDALLGAVRPRPAIENFDIDSRAASEARELFFEEVRRALEQRLSALAIHECIRVERDAPAEGEWGEGDVSDVLTVDGVSPLAYVRQAAEDEKKIIRFGVVPIDRAGEQVLAAIEEADEALGRSFFGA